MRGYLADASKHDQLIPAVSGLGDVALQSQIQAYNDLMLERDRIKVNSGGRHRDNTDLDRINVNLGSMRKALIQSMDNYIATEQTRLDRARSEIVDAESEIAAMPQKQKMAR